MRMNLDRSTAPEMDVAIVGLGPTGAVLAALLGAFGWRVGVFEREPDLLDLPRAVHFDGEVMRVFQSLGIASRVEALARPSGGMQYVNVAGQLMLERKPAASTGVHGWANNYLFHQPDLERALRVAALRWPTVLLHARHEVENVSQGDRSATLTVRDLATGVRGDRPARWVVGCDGARSRVRDAIGCAHDDLGLHQSWLVVDVLLKRPVDLPAATVQFCDPARPVTFVNVTGMRRRWEIMLMPGDDPARMTEPETVWRLLSRWISPADATLVRGAVYTFHSLIAQRWRKGRLLIAGDAAHQTPPFLGQGMCAGIRDASNLAWKLDLVLRGADATLLDSYASERRPHAQAFVETAVRLGNIIQTTDPAVARERDAQFARGGPQEIVNLSPSLGPGAHGGAAPAGTIAGQPRLSDGRRMDEALGAGFSLLSASPVDPNALPAPARNTWRASGTRALADAALEPWLRELGAPLVLLRPDRYLFGAAHGLDDLAGLVAALPRPTHPSPTTQPETTP